MRFIQLRLKKWLMQQVHGLMMLKSGDYARNNKKLRLTKGVHVDL